MEPPTAQRVEATADQAQSGPPDHAPVSELTRRECQLIAEHGRAVVGAQRAFLLLYDEANGRLVGAALTSARVPLQNLAFDLIRRNYPGRDPFEVSYRPSVNAPTAAAFLGQRTQVNPIAEAFENILPPSVIAVAHGLAGITHVVTCPVRADGRALGLIRFLLSGPPTDAQLAVMESAASQIGLTLANAELARQTHRQVTALRALLEISRMARTADLSHMLDALCERVRDLTGADAVVAYVVDAGGGTFSPRGRSVTAAGLRQDQAHARLRTRPIGSGVTGWVIASAEAAFVPDIRRDPRALRASSRPAPEAIVVAPMRVGGRVMGALRISAVGGRRFTESDLWLLQLVADETGAIIQALRGRPGEKGGRRPKAAHPDAGGYDETHATSTNPLSGGTHGNDPTA